MKPLPSYKNVKSSSPLTSDNKQFIANSRQEIKNILNGVDNRLLLIVGPCSIHDRVSSIEFAMHLKKLSEFVKDHFLLVMRVYCEKPRTVFGWKGFLYDPFLNGSNDIQTGIEWTRRLMLELTDLEVPIATEFLDPLTAFYYEDLVSWGSIGARTSSSQIHRQFASGLTIPIGFKNGIAGNISSAINGIVAASVPHFHMSLDENGAPCIAQTLGNPDTHVVLRGGENGPNYDPLFITETLLQLENLKQSSRLLIDCSHHNSSKRSDLQPLVFQSVIHQYLEGNSKIRGLMLESHLKGGRQSVPDEPSQLEYGISITDDCLDWDSTRLLIESAMSLFAKQGAPSHFYHEFNLTSPF